MKSAKTTVLWYLDFDRLLFRLALTATRRILEDTIFDELQD